MRVHLTSGTASSEAALQELLQLMSRALNMRPTQMAVIRGGGPKERVLTVEVLAPRQVYRALKDGGKGGGGGDGGKKRRPWFAGL